MGQYLSGRLAYGYWIGDEDGDGLDEETQALIETWVDRLAIADGAVNPWEADHYLSVTWSGLPYAQKRLVFEQWSAEHADELTAWHAAKQLVEDRYNVEFDSGGIGGYNVTALVIKESGFQAHDSITQFTESEIRAVRSPDWDEHLQIFAKTIGLELSGEPGWFVLLSYG